MKKCILFAALAVLSLICGCRVAYNANKADLNRLNEESTVIFTRPARYTPFFGTYSISDFVDIVYERASRNQAGQLVVEVGIRYRGPVRWTNWFRNMPPLLSLKSKCNFYRGNHMTPIVYSTNQRELVIGRGETFAYRAVCPNKDVDYYQLVLGD